MRRQVLCWRWGTQLIPVRDCVPRPQDTEQLDQGPREQGGVDVDVVVVVGFGQARRRHGRYWRWGIQLIPVRLWVPRPQETEQADQGVLEQTGAAAGGLVVVGQGRMEQERRWVRG